MVLIIRTDKTTAVDRTITVAQDHTQLAVQPITIILVLVLNFLRKIFVRIISINRRQHTTTQLLPITNTILNQHINTNIHTRIMDMLVEITVHTTAADQTIVHTSMQMVDGTAAGGNHYY